VNRRSLLLITLLLIFAAGCSTVRPPATVKDPATIYLAVYGVHSSVLLPYGPEHYVEYSFGDWAYAAENYQMPWNALAALFISFQSTLGRNWIHVEPGQTTPQTYLPTKRLVKMQVERAKVDKIVKDFDRRYDADKGPPTYDDESNTFFVKDSKHYSWLNNCNHMTLDILEEAGCDVSGWGVTSGITVKEPKK